MSVSQSSPEHRKYFYRTLWRWHFYAGLLIIPFVLALSISGAIYLFKPQIESWIDKPWSQLQTNGEPPNTVLSITL